LAVVPAGQSQEAPKTLLIGTSGTLGGGAGEAKEAAALQSLKEFIKDETGLANEIVRQKGWHELAEKMSRKQIPLGVFQGYEFVWAQEEYPVLKPLELAVNGPTYPAAYVVTSKNDPAGNFVQLQGYSLGLPDVSKGFPYYFVERQAQAQGKKPDAFFSKITPYDNVEDALDDVVDGKIQATVVDQAGLEAFKRRKPGRFQKLKAAAHSERALPVVIVYADEALPQATLDRFRNGLLKASERERGQTLLTMFHLTRFEKPPTDFDRVVKEMRKAYPPPEQGK